MTTQPSVRRLTLQPTTPRERGQLGRPVRRYRIARLELIDDVVARNARFAHLKSPHD